MGGYGALRQAFIHMDRFAKVIAMSPTSDIEFAARFSSAMGVESKYIMGDWKTLKGSELDLMTMAQDAAGTGERVPDILIIMADEDHMVRDTTEFEKKLNELQLKNEFRLYPGDHSWKFWDAHIEECIDWLTDRN